MKTLAEMSRSTFSRQGGEPMSAFGFPFDNAAGGVVSLPFEGQGPRDIGNMGDELGLTQQKLTFSEN